MDLFQLLVLSVVQGVTEFLPVSSTGHLILTAHLMDMPESEFLKSFLIAIQAGTILSVVVLYWRELFTKIEVIKRVAAAFIPTAVIGYIFYKLIKTYLLGNTMVVLAALFLGGVLIIAFEIFHREEKSGVPEVGQMPFKTAVLIGVFQALAIIPGVSRSAATILGGLSLRVKRKTIVEFSFLLAAPTLMAATVLDLLKSASSFSGDQIAYLFLGGLVSFLVAIAGIRFFLKFIQRFSFIGFGVYRIFLAVLFWYFG